MRDVAARLRRRELSVHELVAAQIDRIERLDAKLHAFARLSPERALERARALDAEPGSGRDRGPLHGIPLALQDLFWERGERTAAGTTVHRDFVATQDATVVARLKDAGAVLIGSAQLTEGADAMHHPSITPPVNPWHEGYWSGASSSGSGVAVATGAAVRAAIAVLAELGAEVRPIEFPAVDGIVADWFPMCAVQTAVAHAATYPSRKADYGEELAGLIELGRGLSATEFQSVILRRLEFAGRVDAALAMAAVRECYEETGLMLGSPDDVGRTGHPSWEAFRARGISPELGKLAFLGRAITPTYHSLRYHARFFNVPYEELQGSSGGDGELEDLRWVRADRPDDVHTTIVQSAMLDTLHRRRQALPAPPRKLFYAWGRHHAVAL